MHPSPLLKESDLTPREKEKKQQIIDKTITFYSQNGIWDTTIDDIIRFIEIGKGTFYRYFENKKDLFLHCIERITTISVPEEVLEDIQKESDYRARMKKRFDAFLKGYPTISGILSLANQGLQSNDPDMERQAKKTYQMFVAPLIKDFIKDKKNELIRDIDEEIVAYLILGMGQSMGNFLKINKGHSAEALADIALDFVARAIYLPENHTAAHQSAPLYWKICDRENNTEQLYNLSFNDRTYFPGNAGKWEIQISTEHIVSITFQKKDDDAFSAAMVLKNGQSRVLIVDGDTLLCGETELGRIRIPLREVASVCSAQMSEP